MKPTQQLLEVMSRVADRQDVSYLTRPCDAPMHHVTAMHAAGPPSSIPIISSLHFSLPVCAGL